MKTSDALTRLMELQMGFLTSGCLYVIAKLKVPDQLPESGRASDEIARNVGADARMLYRIMRFLASKGVFREEVGKKFLPTPISNLLKVDVEGSYWAFAIANSERGMPAAALEFLPGVVHGEIPFVRYFGEHPFASMATRPELATLLEKAWQGIHWPETEAILDAYSFESVARLADIGGGHGDVVIEFLQRFPGRTGVIFDTPLVAGHAQARLRRMGLSGRCDAISGDFFREIPIRADAFLLRHILHDWNDDECVTILRNIAAACGTRGRVLIAECVLREPNLADIGKLFDIQMLLHLTGEERSEGAYAELLTRAGFSYRGITPTESIISIMEGVLVTDVRDPLAVA